MTIFVRALGFTAVREVGAHEHQAGQLPLRSRGRLKGDGGQARDLGQDLLEAPHHLERTLSSVLLLERVQVAEAGQVHDALVDPRVVLHRARAERVEAGVDAEGARRDVREMTDELGLRDLGQARRRSRRSPSGRSGTGSELRASSMRAGPPATSRR